MLKNNLQVQELSQYSSIYDIFLQLLLIFSLLTKSSSYSGADGGNGGTITLRMRDTDSGLIMLFVKAWTPYISYSLNVSGGKGGNPCFSVFQFFGLSFL
jgi:hypothetical protein